MMTLHIHSRTYQTAGIAALLAVLTLLAGCGLFSRGSRPVSVAEGRLVRQVGLLPFFTAVSLGHPELQQALEADFQAALNKACPAVRLIDVPLDPGDGNNTTALLQTGRNMGLQAIVSAGLVSLEHVTERPLLLFWTRRELLNSVFQADVLDMQSGARLFSGIFEDSHRAGGLNPVALRTATPGAMDDLRRKLSREMKQISQATCRSIKQQPWHTFVMVAQEDRVTLPVGQPSGLVVGDELQVLALTPVIESYQGPHLQVPGNPTGRLRVTRVDAGQTHAHVISGEVAAGSLVRR